MWDNNTNKLKFGRISSGFGKTSNASHKKHIKGPRKRTDEDNEKFVEALEQLLDKVIDFQ